MFYHEHYLQSHHTDMLLASHHNDGGLDKTSMDYY